jgi:hypothetical protein
VTYWYSIVANEYGHITPAQLFRDNSGKLFGKVRMHLGRASPVLPVLPCRQHNDDTTCNRLGGKSHY